MSKRFQLFPLVAFIFVAVALSQAMADDSQSRPPVSNSDAEIVKTARHLVDSPAKWNRADNRICPNHATKFSLYCALEKATYAVTGSFSHRGATMQEARFVIDDDLAPDNNYHHRLMDYNNDPKTTFENVKQFFDLLQGRVEARLEDQNAGPAIAARPAAEKVTQSDIDILRRVETILASPAKWDRTSTQDCDAHAQTFGLYCAFQAASIAVTGKFDGRAPGIREVRQLIGRTVPNSARYSARLVDYNNDPTVTFKDLQALLKTAEGNLQKRMAASH